VYSFRERGTLRHSLRWEIKKVASTGAVVRASNSTQIDPLA